MPKHIVLLKYTYEMDLYRGRGRGGVQGHLSVIFFSRYMISYMGEGHSVGGITVRFCDISLCKTSHAS